MIASCPFTHPSIRTTRAWRRTSKILSLDPEGIISVFFFPRENQKCPWKPFLPIFFTRGKRFSRALFRVFSVFFTGRRKIFTGGISRVAQFFFTGTILPPPGICFFGLFSPDQRMVIGCVYHFLHLSWMLVGHSRNTFTRLPIGNLPFLLLLYFHPLTRL